MHNKLVSIDKSVGATSFGLVLDFVGGVPHVHILFLGMSVTIGRGWSYENIHEMEARPQCISVETESL